MISCLFVSLCEGSPNERGAVPESVDLATAVRLERKHPAPALLCDP
jgi:hypothetical protein